MVLKGIFHVTYFMNSLLYNYYLLINSYLRGIAYQRVYKLIYFYLIIKITCRLYMLKGNMKRKCYILERSPHLI